MLFLVSAGFMAEFLAFFCSSPQTAEINAAQRSATLMKWVKLGLIGGAVFVGIAAVAEPESAGPIIAGGAAMGGVAAWAYIHANNAGLASGLPGTENY
jgi:hypothetical protein